MIRCVSVLYPVFFSLGHIDPGIILSNIHIVLFYSFLVPLESIILIHINIYPLRKHVVRNVDLRLKSSHEM